VFGKLLILFILIPLIELFLFLTLGDAIGIQWTIAIIIITAIIGAALTKSQGRKAMERFQQATSEGRLPHQEAMDGVMILIAGAVLLTPGFLTDAVGFALLIPPVRAVLRSQFGQRLKDKIQIVPSAAPTSSPKNPSPLDNGKVIDV